MPEGYKVSVPEEYSSLPQLQVKEEDAMQGGSALNRKH